MDSGSHLRDPPPTVPSRGPPFSLQAGAHQKPSFNPPGEPDPPANYTHASNPPGNPSHGAQVPYQARGPNESEEPSKQTCQMQHCVYDVHELASISPALRTLLELEDKVEVNLKKRLRQIDDYHRRQTGTLTKTLRVKLYHKLEPFQENVNLLTDSAQPSYHVTTSAANVHHNSISQDLPSISGTIPANTSPFYPQQTTGTPTNIQSSATPILPTHYAHTPPLNVLIQTPSYMPPSVPTSAHESPFSQLPVGDSADQSSVQPNRHQQAAAYRVQPNSSAFLPTHLSSPDTRALYLPSAATWTLYVEGALVDQDAQQDSPSFSSFLKKIDIQLDPSEFGDQSLIEWTPDVSDKDVCGFQLRRTTASAKSVIHIFFHFTNSYPGLFIPSPPLRQLLGIQEPYVSKTSMITYLWNYVRLHKLQDASQKSHVICDAPLRDALQIDSFNYEVLPELAQQHLRDPEPVHLVYTISSAGDDPSAIRQLHFDLPVVVNTQDNKAPDVRTKFQAEIQQLDQEIAKLLELIREKKRKQTFYFEYIKDPLAFVSRFIQSQSRDRIVANCPYQSGDLSKMTNAERPSST